MTSADIARLVLDYLSDKGLQHTKSVFFNECLDLRNDDLGGSSDLMNGQKLSLIIEEYFVLKGHDKKSKHDPQSILLLLWKQFDVLVGQLKHSTIHAKEKAKAGTGVPQKIRVRELNRQNRSSLQKRKLNTVFIPNHDLLKVQHIKCETVKSNQGFTLAPQCLGNAIAVDSRLPFNNVCGVAETFQPPCIPNDNYQLIPVVQCEVLQRNTIAENIGVVMNSNSSSMMPHHPLNETMVPLPKDQLLLGDQFKSPKRKSVQPKRYSVFAEPVSKSPVIIPVIETSPDEAQLDLSSLVEKILGQPEFSEKLAENINRAVEIDTPTNHKELKGKDNSSTATQGALVDSVKVDNIMDMMKTDPAFEELFSSFESFTNCEESDLEPRNQNEEHGDVETNQTKSTSTKGNCASDALLLLASSPAKSSSQQDELNSSHSLNTPNKNNHSVSQKLVQALDMTGAIFHSPCSSTLSSIAVVMSPGKAKSPTNRAAQPIFSHVRQLDFSNVGNISGVSNSGVKSSGNGTSACAETTVVAPDPTHCLTSTMTAKNSGQEQETAAGKKVSERKSSAEDGISVAGGQTILDASPYLPKNAQVNFRRNVVGYKNISQCSQLVRSENGSREEDGDEESAQNNEKKTSSSDNEESSLSVLEELATHVFTQCEEGAHETESKDCLLMVSKKGDREENEGQGVPRNELAFHESTGTEEEHAERKTVLTEGLKTESCASFADGFTSIKQALPGGSSHKKVFSNTGSLNPRDASDPTVAQDSEGCLGKKSVNEESEELLRKVNQRTPLTNVTGSAEFQVPKRKLKKNKKSNGTTKKRKTLPANLDVDKFLSRLHYVEKTHKTTP